MIYLVLELDYVQSQNWPASQVTDPLSPSFLPFFVSHLFIAAFHRVLPECPFLQGSHKMSTVHVAQVPIAQTSTSCGN